MSDPSIEKPLLRRTSVRVWLGVLLIVAAAFGLHHVSIARQRAAFHARVAELQRAGQLVTTADVHYALRVPDDQNAAIPLRRAAALVPDADLDEAYWKEFSKHSFVLPLTDIERDLAKRQLVNIDQISPLIEEAAAMPRASWLPPPGREGNDYPLGGQRMLADALGNAALLEADAGNLAAALDRVRQIRVIARALQSEGTLVGYLVAVGVEALALARLEELGPHLAIGKPGGATAEGVRQMIAQLQDESDLEAAIRLGYQGDRAQLLEKCLKLANGEMIDDTSSPDPLARLSLYINRPGLCSSSARMLETYGAIVTAIDAPDWPACQRHLDALSSHAARTGIIDKLVQNMMPSNRAIAVYRFEAPIRRRLARTALAVHLYAADHGGSLPEALDELAPEYLPAIPVDAMAPSPAPIRYVTTGEPLLYSIGRDGIDNGGAELVVERLALQELGGTRRPKELGDILYRLTPRPRPSPEEEPQVE